jgi:hypothetical protein
MYRSLADLLSLRFQYEQIVSFRRTFDLPNYNSDIDNLNHFVIHGAKNNRFRKRYNEALDIAKIIIESYENDTIDLSSIHRKKKRPV